MYYNGVVRVQRNHLEHIDRMSELVERLLQNYAKENEGRLPEHIFYFRDGVAETQCEKVCEISRNYIYIYLFGVKTKSTKAKSINQNTRLGNLL